MTCFGNPPLDAGRIPATVDLVCLAAASTPARQTARLRKPARADTNIGEGTITAGAWRAPVFCGGRVGGDRHTRRVASEPIPEGSCRVACDDFKPTKCTGTDDRRRTDGSPHDDVVPENRPEGACRREPGGGR